MLMLLILMCLSMILGMVVVAFNPSPYFAALGLVVVAGAAGVVLVLEGAPFLALMLIIVYLGGMLVAFAYATAISADLFPSVLNSSVSSTFAVLLSRRTKWELAAIACLGGMGSVVGIACCYNIGGLGMTYSFGGAKDVVAHGSCRDDIVGASSTYMPGSGMLIICVWALVYALAIVLVVSRGESSGGVRSV